MRRPLMLIYLHGLNSSSASFKAGELRKHLAPIEVQAPSYPAHRPDEAVATLSEFISKIEREQPPMLVGSSMGGFYGQYIARQFPLQHLFLINPAVAPWTLLPAYEGQWMTTANGLAYQITRELIDQTRRYGIDAPCDGVPTTLFLDKEDEVIDYRIAETLYRDCGRLLIFEGGDHSFQHLEQAIAVIRATAAPL